MSILKSLLTLPVLLTVVRFGLKAVGPLLIANGWLDADGLEKGIINIMALVGLVWGMVAAAKKKPELEK